MELRTAEIIMICKGKHTFGKELSSKNAIKAYLSARCNVPIECFKDNSIINNEILKATIDFINGVSYGNAGFVLWQAKDILNRHNNGLFKDIPMDFYEALCQSFQLLPVKHDGQYINGFNEINTKIVTEKENEEITESECCNNNKKTDSLFRYFISYFYTDCNANTGYGDCYVDYNEELNYNTIEVLRENIISLKEQYKNVVILNIMPIK